MQVYGFYIDFIFLSSRSSVCLDCGTQLSFLVVASQLMSGLLHVTMLITITFHNLHIILLAQEM